MGMGAAMGNAMGNPMMRQMPGFNGNGQEQSQGYRQEPYSPWVQGQQPATGQEQSGQNNSQQESVQQGAGTVECPSCHESLPAMAKFCFACGTRIERREQGVCRGCGSKLVPGAVFCYVCGRKVDQ